MYGTDVFREVESLYFKEKYEDVIKYWETNKHNYTFGIKEEDDINILDSILESYHELKNYPKCMYYLKIQIKNLNFLELSEVERERRLRYYYLLKVNIFAMQNKRISEYRTILEYPKNKTDQTFTEWLNFLEESFYRKYIIFNRILLYSIICLIIFFIIMQLSNIYIINSLYKDYNIISIICIVWIVLNFLFPTIFKSLFIISLRFVLRC
jgi:hypothetical protein